MEGSVISWVANHRRHHAYTDRNGDPHSPYEYGNGTWNQVPAAALHAHVDGCSKPSRPKKRDGRRTWSKDKDLAAISRMFPLLGVALFGSSDAHRMGRYPDLGRRVWRLIWGGLIRVFVLHHATFSVNSVCHLWGRRPFTTRVEEQIDQLRSFALLAMGENWHNLPSFVSHPRPSWR